MIMREKIRVMKNKFRIRRIRFYSAKVTSIQKSPQITHRTHGDSSQSPYPYPWEYPWESPYPRQPSELGGVTVWWRSWTHRVRLSLSVCLSVCCTRVSIVCRRDGLVNEASTELRKEDVEWDEINERLLVAWQRKSCCIQLDRLVTTGVLSQEEPVGDTCESAASGKMLLQFLHV